MPKKIIILERVNPPSDYSFRYCLWAENPIARKNYSVNPDFVSAFKGATQDEILAIQDGSIIEETGIAQYKEGTPLEVIQEDLRKRFEVFQQKVNEQNKLSLYGTFFDDNGWTEGGVK